MHPEFKSVMTKRHFRPLYENPSYREHLHPEGRRMYAAPMLRIAATLLVAASVCCAQPSNDRLATTIKLWNHLKYFHTRVTAPDVDWDAALAKAVPRIMAAKNDDEFAEVVSEMLSALHDPATHVVDIPGGPDHNVVRVLPPVDGVSVVTFEPGNPIQGFDSMRRLPVALAQAETVVFDLRGVETAPSLLRLPFAQACVGPSYASREHSGYAGLSGSSTYTSSWKVQDAESFPVSARPIRTVFLINSRSRLPNAALAAQTCGVGAIVSEGPVTDEVADTTRNVPDLGTLRVTSRIYELVYPDFSTGFHPNAVLNQTGEAALKASIALARAGKWPSIPARGQLTLPRAAFVEKNDVVDPYPAMEYRVIAAARVWGVFQHFHPYRQLYDEDWDKVLHDFLPKIQKSENARQYHLAVAEMVVQTHDTHCYMGSSELDKLYGDRPPGLELLWVDNQPVVLRVVDPKLKESIHAGDIVTHLNGEPVQKRIGELSPYLAASTPQSLINSIMECLLRSSADSSLNVTLKTASGEREVVVARERGNWNLLSPHRGGAVFRLITPQIGYVDLERLNLAQVDEMFETLKDTTGIIMDMRGYPRNTVFGVASRLADSQGKIGARFLRKVTTAASPGSSFGPRASTRISNQTTLLEQPIPSTDKPRYAGKTVMLIDERAVSQSEHAGVFFRTANGTVFIGSPTQGANGDVTSFMAPGGISINFTGVDARWPDGKQLQRVGLAPDVLVRPTTEGIRAGRDEVLERAVEYLRSGR